MVQVSRRTGFTGSALIDLLSRLSSAEIRPSKQEFSDRLSQWLGWTDAIALSSALARSNAPVARAEPAATIRGEDAQCAQIRSAMVAAIAEDLRVVALAPTPDDFAPYRRRYIARQQAMASSIDALRSRLRETLAARSGDMAKLVEIETVLAKALDAQAARLLATVPASLATYFKRLRDADPAQHNAAENADNPPPPDWLDTFTRDMHSVLLAELDLRLQPVEGLLEALRAG